MYGKYTGGVTHICTYSFSILYTEFHVARMQSKICQSCLQLKVIMVHEVAEVQADNTTVHVFHATMFSGTCAGSPLLRTV